MIKPSDDLIVYCAELSDELLARLLDSSRRFSALLSPSLQGERWRAEWLRAGFEEERIALVSRRIDPELVDVVLASDPPGRLLVELLRYTELSDAQLDVLADCASGRPMVDDAVVMRYPAAKRYHRSYLQRYDPLSRLRTLARDDGTVFDDAEVATELLSVDSWGASVHPGPWGILSYVEQIVATRPGVLRLLLDSPRIPERLLEVVAASSHLTELEDQVLVAGLDPVTMDALGGRYSLPSYERARGALLWNPRTCPEVVSAVGRSLGVMVDLRRKQVLGPFSAVDRETFDTLLELTVLDREGNRPSWSAGLPVLSVWDLLELLKNPYEIRGSLANLFLNLINSRSRIGEEAFAWAEQALRARAPGAELAMVEMASGTKSARSTQALADEPVASALANHSAELGVFVAERLGGEIGAWYMLFDLIDDDCTHNQPLGAVVDTVRRLSRIGSLGR